MPSSFNQTNKEDSPVLWLKQIRHHSLKGGVWVLLFFSLSTVNAQQPGLEAQLESLAAAYREDENPGNHAKLLAFCQRNTKSPQAALGFFLLGYRDFQDGNFPEAKETLGPSSRSATPIQDYAVLYLASVAFELKEFKESQDQLRDFSSRFPKSPPLGEGPVTILAEFI